MRNAKEDISVHKEEIIKYLKRLVEVESDVYIMWHKWKKVSIELPAVGEFKWYKTTIFTWNNVIFWETYKNWIKQNKELVEKMYCKQDVCNLLEKLKECIKELHKYIYKSEVNIDENIDFWYDLNCYNDDLNHKHKFKTDTSDILISLLGIPWTYYLNNEVVTFSGKMPILWKCCSSFDLDKDDNWGELLLKLSD